MYLVLIHNQTEVYAECLSYNEALDICETLENLGISTWIDREYI